MTKDEAMKLALEALEYWQKLCLDNGRASHELGRSTNAITALRQAIQEAEKQEQWTPDDMAHRPGGLSMEDEPDLSEQGRNRSAVLGNNIQAMVDAGLPFLDALETTLKVYDHPTKPQEDMAYRPGGLSMEQKPVAWWNPDESGLAFQKLRGDWQPLYAAPVHAIDTLEKHVDETAKDKHDPNVYGDGNVYRGVRSKDSQTKTLYCKTGDCDWCLLEATQESLREHMAEIRRLQEEIKCEERRFNDLWDQFAELTKSVEQAKEVEPVALEKVYETIIQWDEGGGKRSRRELARRIVDRYTAPPHHEWVCLTDAEAWEEWVKAVDSSNHSDRLLAFRYLRAIEAKLKEKNT